MTAFESKTFSITEGRSEVPEAERRQNWAQTFGNSCTECDRLGYAQTPMRHVKCESGCGRFYCPEHKIEHFARYHNFIPTPKTTEESKP